MPVHEYTVEMTCEGCSSAVERVLNRMKDKGVDKVEIDLTSKKVSVTTSLTSDEVLDVIKKTGKAATYLNSS